MIFQRLKTALAGTDVHEIFSHGKNYFSADVAARALAVVSMPIFTRLYTEADYGVLAVFQAYACMFTIIVSLNLFSAVSRYYYEERDDFPEFLGTTLIVTLVCLAVFLLLTLSFWNRVGVALRLPGWLPLYLFFQCAIEVLIRIYNQILIARKQSREFAGLNVFRGYGSFALAVLLVWLLSEDRYRGQIWAGLLIGAVLLVYTLVRLIPLTRLVFRGHCFRYILSYSLPLLPYALSGEILAQVDRILINNMVNAKAAGIYSLGYNVGMLLTMVITATQSALLPNFFDFMNKGQYGRLDLLVRRVFTIIIFSALGIIFFSRELVFVLADAKFRPALVVVPWVVLGYVFFALFTIYGRYIGFYKRTGWSSFVVLYAGLVNVFLNAWWIPKIGMLAGAYTTAISYAVMFLLTWWVSRWVLKATVTPLIMLMRPLGIFIAGIAAWMLLVRCGPSLWILLPSKALVLIICGLWLFRGDLGELMERFRR